MVNYLLAIFGIILCGALMGMGSVPKVQHYTATANNTDQSNQCLVREGQSISINVYSNGTAHMERL